MPALLLEKALSVIVAVPLEVFWSAPPLLPGALLPEKTQFVTFSVPSLLMPPPVGALPFVTARFCRLSAALKFTLNTRAALPPLMVTSCPAPSMVSVPRF